ncbi:MAG TPA: hypothetical protein VGK20_03040 [Candidatus Binatia bacterium]|jgi:hypothetical protein
MPRSSKPEALPLTGADCFLRAFEAEVRRTAGASHLSQLVLRLGPGFDVDAFVRLVTEVAEANPIVRAPIRRRGGIGAPVYLLDSAVDSSRVRVHVHAGGSEATGSGRPASDAASPLGPVPAVFFDRLNDRFDMRRGVLLAFDVVPRGGTSAGHDVAMTWQHMLMDGSGSELFVEHLAQCSADPAFARDIAITRAQGGASSPAVTSLPPTAGARGHLAQQWNLYMQGMAARPPGSLAGPLRRTSQKLRYEQLRLGGDSASAAMQRAKSIAGFLTPMLFFLAVSVRAHQAVAERRRRVPASWIVPLPVNMRPKGGQGEVFRTHVSLLWFQVTPGQAADLGVLVEALKAQRLEAIRAGLVEAGVAAMDFARYAPARVYSHMARRTFGGELASFFFAYTGEFAARARSLCGAPILDAFHAPSVPPSPGSALVFCLRDGLDVVHVHQQGILNDAELACMHEQLLADLRGS